MHRFECFCFVVVLCLLGAVHSQSNNSVFDADTLNKLKNNVNIPELNGIDLNSTNIDNARDKGVETVLKKCKRVGGAEAADKFESAMPELQKCILSVINITELMQEVDMQKYSGNLDEVFGKYCRKSPAIIECVKNFTTSIEGCLEEEEYKTKEMAMNVTTSLIEFVCYKDGDRIAMFVAEGGFECIGNKTEQIQECVRKTFGNEASKAAKNQSLYDTVPLLILTPEKCSDALTTEKCILAELEKCALPTPANLVESLLKFAKRMTPCGSYAATSASQKSNPNSVTKNVAIGAIVLAAVALLRIF